MDQLEDQLDLNVGAYQGSAILKAQGTKIVRGRPFSVHVEFKNRGGGDNFYNVFFLRGILLPAKLAVYGSNKKYIGDLLFPEEGARTTIGTQHWTYVPANGIVGADIELTAGYVPGTDFDSLSHLLPAGEYYLQMIYYYAFILPKPSENKAVGDLEKDFDRRELFRSNVVKIELVNA